MPLFLVRSKLQGGLHATSSRDAAQDDQLVPEILLSLTLFLLSFVSFTNQPGYAIPAFARKYGLPCSACHIGWPILNNFGLAFKDNGYQLGNDKDSADLSESGIFSQLPSELHRSGILRTRRKF